MRFPKNKAHVFLTRRQNADRWITVHPNGADTKGRPALIDGEGIVKGGMGGKFNGKKIGDARKGAESNQTEQSTKKSVPGWSNDLTKKKNPYSYGTSEWKVWEQSGGDKNKLSDGMKELVARKEKDRLDTERMEKARKDFVQGNTYLNVPFSDKDAAKAAGARWDGNERKWYMPKGKEVPESLKKYIPKSRSGTSDHEMTMAKLSGALGKVKPEMKSVAEKMIAWAKDHNFESSESDDMLAFNDLLKKYREAGNAL